MHIYFRPYRKDILRYAVKIKMFDSNTNKSNILSYISDVTFEKETFKGYIINFKRSDIFINNQKENDPMNEILLITGSLLDDLDLEVSELGKIIKIKNLKDILEKWKEIRFKVEETYIGDIVKNIINGIEKNVTNEQEFISSLKKDPFFYNYLRNIYGEYANNKSLFNTGIYGFARLNNIPIQKRLVAEKLDTGEILVLGKGIVSVETKELLCERFSNRQIEVILETKHKITQDKYISDISLTQRLFQDQKITNSLEMEVKLMKER